MGKSENNSTDSRQRKTHKVHKVPLTRGLVALIDKDDIVAVGWDNWHASVSGGRSYAVRRAPRGSKSRVIYMHRVIANAPEGITVDHINGDTLDNRRCNLRLCSHAENVRNRSKSRTRQSSKYLGVYFDKARQKWRACIRLGGKPTHLGSFSDERAAAKAYDAAALAHHGQFARLNFPTGSSTPSRFGQREGGA